MSEEILLQITGNANNVLNLPTLNVAPEVLHNLGALKKDDTIMVGTLIICQTAHVKALEFKEKSADGITCLLSFPHPDPTIHTPISATIHTLDSYTYIENDPALHPDSPDANTLWVNCIIGLDTLEAMLIYGHVTEYAENT